MVNAQSARLRDLDATRDIESRARGLVRNAFGEAATAKGSFVTRRLSSRIKDKLGTVLGSCSEVRFNFRLRDWFRSRNVE
jgi:hypothetical protein